MTTKPKVLSAARKRWPGATLVENRKAPTKEQRAEMLTEAASIRERIETAKRVIASTEGAYKALVEAVRFYLDTDCDTSIVGGMRDALERCERRMDATNDEKELRQQVSRMNFSARRWCVMEDRGFFRVVVKSADTLPELLLAILKEPA